ncbi:MAG: GNAT family N-acetyltransferase [Rhodospirillaceae bacterium]
MTIEAFPFTDDQDDRWDALCRSSVNGTFLHTRAFLSYHETRFEDASVTLFLNGLVVGVMPAARHPADPRIVVSHPGITYGGIVHDGSVTGSRMIAALEALVVYFGGLGYDRMVYKAIPYIYAEVPAQDDLYALFRLGARRSRCDLAATIDLTRRLEPSTRRKRSLKKARKAVILTDDMGVFPGFWEVVADNLARKHDARPVHSLAEITLLHRRFPDNILLRAAVVDGRVVAGVLLFVTPRVWHAQYIGSSETGYQHSALDAVFEGVIEEARVRGARYVDFGTSNEDGGRVLNDGLYRFKMEFGGGGVAYEFFDLDIGEYRP